MNSIPKIGTRVAFKNPVFPDRECVGEVVAVYRGGDWHTDPETGERYQTQHHVGVRVDAPLPKWWPYAGTDRFAPAISDVEEVA